MRYVRVGDQVTDDGNGCDFAFFDTICDRFVVVGGEQLFSSRSDFDMWAKDDPLYGRLSCLIPDEQE